MHDLKAFDSYNGVFVEITKSEHGHGGEGWEYGTCLWSPTTNVAGEDRYSIMREPSRGDLILHFYHDKWPDGHTGSRLAGTSIVAESVIEVYQQPPSPGNWGGRDAYYRIDLEDYMPFNYPVPLSILYNHYEVLIRHDLIENNPRFYPFTTYQDRIRTVQGIYLAKATPALYDVFLRALGITEAAAAVPTPDGDLHEEFTEARRRAAEHYFWARNPQLREQALEFYGTICQVCAFDFEEVYGELGRGFIELHHKNPLSELSEAEWTSELRTNVHDVAVVCANCHCMIHRRRPALSLEDVFDALS